ncbi:hypothetical protein HW555_003034 [Spodoptera exigua]|uniref:Uncharacterized protein n=1 Tax=Spodoptera exigua TaxID=7107 RepID=A0A835GKX7_SPOEX|nr:hypothetical protein HW555_003034 [Spodoptera exigua]
MRNTRDLWWRARTVCRDVDVMINRNAPSESCAPRATRKRCGFTSDAATTELCFHKNKNDKHRWGGEGGNDVTVHDQTVRVGVN